MKPKFIFRNKGAIVATIDDFKPMHEGLLAQNFRSRIENALKDTSCSTHKGSTHLEITIDIFDNGFNVDMTNSCCQDFRGASRPIVFLAVASNQ